MMGLDRTGLDYPFSSVFCEEFSVGCVAGFGFPGLLVLL